MHRGYIKLYRKIQDSRWWNEKRVYSKAEAWIDLLMGASYKMNTIIIGSKSRKVDRGEVVKSLRFWAGKWGWSKSKVSRFFCSLQEIGSIVILESGADCTHIKICEYDIYQGSSDTDLRAGQQRDTHDQKSGTPENEKTGQASNCNTPTCETDRDSQENENGTATGHPMIKKRDTINTRIKNYKKEEEEECPLPPLFQYWISKPNLPKHRACTASMRAAEARTLKEHTMDELRACLDAYDQIMGSQDDFFGKYPHTFEDFFRPGKQKPAPYLKFMPEMDPLNKLKKEGSKWDW